MRISLILASIVTWSQFSSATPVIPDAYIDAASTQKIPPVLLYAVAQQESNTKLNIGFFPWPWTLNIAGKGYGYKTRHEACSALMTALQDNRSTAVDIGIAQQNWGWVGKKHYKQPCDALNPYDNLRVAALVLRECFNARGNWIQAAGCYHRPAGGEPAQRYMRSISERLQRLKIAGLGDI